MRTTTIALVLLVGCFSFEVRAGETITLEQIMADPDWIGREPESPLWSADSARVYFRRKRKSSDQRDWWVARLDSGSPEKLNLRTALSETPAGGRFDRQRERKVYAFEGDLFVQTVASGSIRQITRTAAREALPEFLADGTSIRFRRGDTLLVRDLQTGLELEPAVLRFEDPPDDPREETRGFLEEKERELFDYLQSEERRSDERREAEQRAERANPFDVDEPYYLGKRNQLSSQELSFDENWLAVVTTARESRQRGRADKMPVWIRDDAYAASRDVRSLVGTDKEGAESLVVLDLKRHRIHEVDLTGLPAIAENPLASLQQRTETAPSAETESDTGGDNETDRGERASEDERDPAQRDKPRPRDIHVRNVSFSADSRFLLFQCFSTDNKDRWVCTLRLTRNRPLEVRVLEHRHDPAWINRRMARAGWLGETRQVYFVSERSGYAHLYVARANNGRSRPLTSGNFEVSSVQASHDGQRIFFVSNATHPGVYELSAVDVASGDVTQLTSLGGANEFRISPDERHAAVLHSELDRPARLVCVELTAGAEPREMADFTSAAFRAVDWSIPEIVAVPTRHGRPVYARLYQPEAAGDATRPAVIFVHGAGYLQNAHTGWSSYFREFMFHSLLARRGYVVLDMDYRASAGYGRDWRTAIYRQMGTPELEDLEDGLDWLAREHNVDRRRVGIYGGSYGGFMTLMALFKRPGMFACGAALRPVTDWAHYNQGYTSNILNTPDIDPEAYETSSPIYFAEGLRDPLLICHGMLDDNVFFKDTVRLTQKLIELEKQNWEVAMYPVEPHGFRRPSSWLDEYRRVLKLFETHLK